MAKQEVSNAEEVKNMIKVRHELGWDKINDFIKWINPEGKADSLVAQWRREVENLYEPRPDLGWEGNHEFIKRHNPNGDRTLLIR